MKYIQVTDANAGTILELFSKKTDAEGYIVEAKTNKRLVCPYTNKHIHVASFSILPGSATFVNNIPHAFAEHMVRKKQVNLTT